MADYVLDASDDDLTEVSVTIVEEFNSMFERELADGLAEAGKVATERLHTTAPRDTGAYARSFRHREIDDGAGHMESLVTTRRHPLTHLLTGGHDIYTSRGGPYGHVGPAHPEGFLEDAAKAGLDALERRIGG